jgi:hypothetical protein
MSTGHERRKTEHERMREVEDLLGFNRCRAEKVKERRKGKKVVYT